MLLSLIWSKCVATKMAADIQAPILVSNAGFGDTLRFAYVNNKLSLAGLQKNLKNVYEFKSKNYYML